MDAAGRLHPHWQSHLMMVEVGACCAVVLHGSKEELGSSAVDTLVFPLWGAAWGASWPLRQSGEGELLPAVCV